VRFLQRFKRPDKSDGLCAVAFYADGLALAKVIWRDDKPQLQLCEFRPHANPDQQINSLKDWVSEHRLQGSPCTWVLAPDAYKLLLIEALNVPDEELRDACKWRVKDMIDIPVDNAAVDVFALPPYGFDNQQKMLYVVVAKLGALSTQAERIRQCELDLTSINITEMAIHNITSLFLHEQSGSTILHLTPASQGVIVSKQGNVYLSRQINAMIEKLSQEKSLNEDHPALDSLVLEVQRSVDYYQSQMGQAAPVQLLLAPTVFDPMTLFSHLSSQLTIQVENIDFNSLLDCKLNLDRVTQSHCLAAIGGAMRLERAQEADCAPAN